MVIVGEAGFGPLAGDRLGEREEVLLLPATGEWLLSRERERRRFGSGEGDFVPVPMFTWELGLSFLLLPGDDMTGCQQVPIRELEKGDDEEC